MTFSRFSICGLLTAAFAGCGSHGLRGPSMPPVPPTPPRACNAIWPGSDQADQGDAVVIARCRGDDEYAKTSAGCVTAHNVSTRKAVTDTPEDVGDAWIVHRRDGWDINAGSWLYRVDKTTFTVQPMR